MVYKSRTLFLVISYFISMHANAGFLGGLLGKEVGNAVDVFSEGNKKSQPGASTQQCDGLTGYGAPSLISKNQQERTQFICRSGYLLQHSGVTKGALWVAEFLPANFPFGEEPRTNNFQPDPELRGDDRSSLGDYKASGYDRGHYAPAADFSSDPKQMSESFYLSNMGPQEPSHNRGIWAEVEKFTRKIASKSSRGLYVVTGPVHSISQGNYVESKTATSCPSSMVEPGCNTTFEKNKATIGRKKVFVPNAYYKVILDPARGEAIAFVIPNMPMDKNHDLKRWLRPLNEVEQMTQIHFFGNLDSKTRVRVENKAPVLWRK